MKLRLAYVADSLAHKLTRPRLRIALVTYSGLPQLSEDDRLVIAPLGARGVRPEAAAWDDPSVKWDRYDALVVRSTWNYHTSFAAFNAWLDGIEALGVPTWNPPSVLRWNASKTYLRELASHGVDVVPTRWIARGQQETLRHVLNDTGWTDAVIKPAVSASAYETWRVTARTVGADDETRFARLRVGSDMMVQPFVPELTRDGEWSLVFLGGEFSHAVLKHPRPGDFRVQHEHGGFAEPRTPSSRVLAAARAVVERIPGPWLYARVDGCEVRGAFLLGELELLEPSLVLSADRSAADRFAESIARL
jgi:glutathione synthase/RimK-type ligase-like ATP-grasp enzyme